MQWLIHMNWIEIKNSVVYTLICIRYKRKIWCPIIRKTTIIKSIFFILIVWGHITNNIYFLNFIINKYTLILMKAFELLGTFYFIFLFFLVSPKYIETNAAYSKRTEQCKFIKSWFLTIHRNNQNNLIFNFIKDI